MNLIEGLGVLVLFLPPYSPDMMPIESAFSKVKSFLKLPWLYVTSVDSTLFYHGSTSLYNNSTRLP